MQPSAGGPSVDRRPDDGRTRRASQSGAIPTAFPVVRVARHARAARLNASRHRTSPRYAEAGAARSSPYDRPGDTAGSSTPRSHGHGAIVDCAAQTKGGARRPPGIDPVPGHGAAGRRPAQPRGGRPTPGRGRARHGASSASLPTGRRTLDFFDGMDPTNVTEFVGAGGRGGHGGRTRPASCAIWRRAGGRRSQPRCWATTGPGRGRPARSGAVRTWRR